MTEVMFGIHYFFVRIAEDLLWRLTSLFRKIFELKH